MGWPWMASGMAYHLGKVWWLGRESGGSTRMRGLGGGCVQPCCVGREPGARVVDGAAGGDGLGEAAEREGVSAMAEARPG